MLNKILYVIDLGFYGFYIFEYVCEFVIKYDVQVIVVYVVELVSVFVDVILEIYVFNEDKSVMKMYGYEVVMVIISVCVCQVFEDDFIDFDLVWDCIGEV